MFKKLAILLAIIPVAAAAQNISGAMVFYSGTLASNVTGGPSPQTVTLNLTGGQKSFTGTLVTGTTLCSTGTPFTVVAIHSTPFAATFSSTNVVALPNDFTGVAGRRNVPMASNGTISSYIGISTIDIPTLERAYNQGG